MSLLLLGLMKADAWCFEVGRSKCLDSKLGEQGGFISFPIHRRL